MSEFTSQVLRQLLAHELGRGNTVAKNETGWSRMDLVVRMRDPLDATFISQHGEAPNCHNFYSNDPHYGPSEFGIVCGREAIVGPQNQ